MTTNARSASSVGNVVMKTADDIRTALAAAEDIEEIIPLVAAAVVLIERAGEAKDVEGYRLGFELKLRVERVGGVLLRKSKKKVFVSKLGIDRVCARWRELAALDDETFAKKVKTTHCRWPPGTRSRPPASASVPPVKVTLSDWYVDEFGVRCRVKAAEGEKPLLKDERPPLET